MKRLLVLLQAWVLPCWLFAQNYAPFLAHYVGDQTHSINQTFTESDTIVLSNYGTVYSLSINATIQQPNEGSFVRIVMEDANGYDYLVAESDWMRNDTTTVNFSGYCEETAKLPGIVPSLLKCYVSGATIVIHSIQTSAFPVLSAPSSISNDSIRRLQVQSIVDRINLYNERHGKHWRADVTDRNLLFYKDRNIDSGERIEDDSYTANTIFYGSGIYEFGQYTTSQSSSSLYPDSVDWRNRHGRNWITPCRNQGGSNWCSVFSTVAATEAYSNLYYNRILNWDLSEEYLAIKIGLGLKKGTRPSIAFQEMEYSGTIDEATLPFHNDTILMPPDSLPQGEISVKTQHHSSYSIRNGIEGLKEILIKKGPVVTGFNAGWNYHVMLCVGYGKITPNSFYYILHNPTTQNEEITILEGDSLIGKDCWIFKDSYAGTHDHGHDGYMYAVFHDYKYMEPAYYPQGYLRSNMYGIYDITCEDQDGDGFFFWGIHNNGKRNLPAWAPDEADGDDSDYTKGPMNDYGYCAELDSLRKRYIYIDHDTTFAPPLPVHNHIVVWKGATVKTEHTVSFEDGTELIVDNGATLIVENLLENVTLRAMPGSHIIVKYNSSIIPYGNFEIPQGVTFEMQNKTSIE